MCQMRVLLSRQEGEELLAEDVSLLQVEADGVKISTLFKEPKLIPGVKVKAIDFLAGKVLLASN